MYIPKITNKLLQWAGVVALSLTVLSFGYLNTQDDVVVRGNDALVGGITRVAIGTQTKWTTDLIPSSSFTVNLGSSALRVNKGWFTDLDVKNNLNNEVHQKDANQLIREIACDVLYIDPPYNSRQYGDSYHLLENIVTWEKPKVEGIGKKMVDREHLKSRYCLKGAVHAFEDLIQNAKTKHILVSYNNTGEKMNERSNAKIPDHRIIEILKERGEVEVFEREYKAFTTGKSEAPGHTEVESGLSESQGRRRALSKG